MPPVLPSPDLSYAKISGTFEQFITLYINQGTKQSCAETQPFYLLPKSPQFFSSNCIWLRHGLASLALPESLFLVHCTFSESLAHLAASPSVELFSSVPWVPALVWVWAWAVAWAYVLAQVKKGLPWLFDLAWALWELLLHPLRPLSPSSALSLPPSQVFMSTSVDVML